MRQPMAMLEVARTWVWQPQVVKKRFWTGFFDCQIWSSHRSGPFPFGLMLSSILSAYGGRASLLGLSLLCRSESRKSDHP